ncbi:MAG: type II toxin-antitoxin system RelE/ParE family toxin [Candidatus Thiodiazotropha sp. L084R]
MPHQVFLTRDVERDLESIYELVFNHDSPANAARLLDNIENTLTKLADFPKRGNHPKRTLGLRNH